MKKPMCTCIWAFLSINKKFIPTQFSLHFGGLEEKIFGFHYLLSFFSIQPNTLQKSFPSHFLSKVFHPLCFTSKQIRHLCMGRCQFSYKALDLFYLSSSKRFSPLVLTLFLFFFSKKIKNTLVTIRLKPFPPHIFLLTLLFFLLHT